MTDETVETTNDGVALTIDNVTNPGNVVIAEGALAAAKQAQLKRAQDAYTNVSGIVLARTASRRGCIAQEVADLKARLAVLAKEEGRLTAATAAADRVGGSILPLAAVVGCKQELIQFMRANNIVVPQNDDPAWSLPE